jgi:hypothetical protein
MAHPSRFRKRNALWRRSTRQDSQLPPFRKGSSSGLAAVVSRGAWGVGVAGRAGYRGSASALAVR